MPKIQRRHRSTRSKVEEEEVPRELPVFLPSVVPEESESTKEDDGMGEEAAKTKPEDKGKLALKLALQEKHRLRREAYLDSLSFKSHNSFLCFKWLSFGS